MKRFKYKTVVCCSDEDLNDLGILGWELATVYKIHPENMNIKFVFKKEII